MWLKAGSGLVCQVPLLPQIRSGAEQSQGCCCLRLPLAAPCPEAAPDVTAWSSRLWDSSSAPSACDSAGLRCSGLAGGVWRVAGQAWAF